MTSTSTSTARTAMMLKMYLPARASRLLLMTSRGEVPQRTPSCPNVDERDHPRACLQWRLDTCDKMFSEASLTRLYFDVLKTGMIGTPDGHELARPTSGIDPAYLQAAQAARQNVKRRRVPRIRSYSPRVFLFLRSPARAWFCGLLLTNRHDGRAVTGVLCTGVVQRRALLVRFSALLNGPLHGLWRRTSASHARFGA